MYNYQLKLIITILSAIAFSLIIIVLIFIVPLNDNKKHIYKTKHKNRLEAISASLNK
jgi:uncharacterized membrane protein